MKKKYVYILAAFFVLVLCIFGSHINGGKTPDGAPDASVAENASDVDFKAQEAKCEETKESKAKQKAECAAELTLRYDDRYEFAKNILTITNGKADSKQAGTNKPDEEVLKVSPENAAKVIAVGCGTAEVNFEDGSQIEVLVEPAPISLLLIAGQSNGEGRPSYVHKLSQCKEQWIANREGMVYTTYGPSDARKNIDMYEEVSWYQDTEKVGELTVKNYTRFLPESLTDNTCNDAYNATNKLTDAPDAIGKGGMDSALAYRWCQLTGEKVWIVNAAHHGSTIQTWNPDDEGKKNNFWQAVSLYTGAEEILSREISAGHYVLSHKGIFWYQGESDYGTGKEYASAFLEMNEALTKELDGNGIPEMNKPVEFTGVLMIRATLDQPVSEEDYVLTGPRRTLFGLAVNRDYPNIIMASQIEEQWYTDEGVATYFATKYGSQEQYESSLPWVGGSAQMPSTVKEVHPQVHYTQLAYNEIGVDAAENVCYALGYTRAPKNAIERIEIVTKDGITVRNGESIRLAGGEELELAVRVYPSYLAKTVEIETSDSIRLTNTGIVLEGSGTAEVKLQVDDGKVQLLAD